MRTLRVSATANGINYLPEYHAAATGAFAKRDLHVSAWPCDPWTGVLADLAEGSADVALGGLWVPAMYAGKTRDLVAIGQLNARFPMAVVTRAPVSDFEWTWMKGRTVLAPGAGGSAPYEFTAGLMRDAGVSPSETRFVRDLSTAMLVELFEHGLGDALIADLLTATTLERSGVGSISCRHAEVGGPMPNSVYYVRRDRLDDLFDRLVDFMSAVDEAMADLRTGSADTDGLVQERWPTTSPGALHDVTQELVANGTWSGVRIEPDPAARWLSILFDAGLVDHEVAFAELVDQSVVDAVPTR